MLHGCGTAFKTTGDSVSQDGSEKTLTWEEDSTQQSDSEGSPSYHPLARTYPGGHRDSLISGEFRATSLPIAGDDTDRCGPEMMSKLRAAPLAVALVTTFRLGFSCTLPNNIRFVVLGDIRAEAYRERKLFKEPSMNRYSTKVFLIIFQGHRLPSTDTYRRLYVEPRVS